MDQPHERAEIYARDVALSPRARRLLVALAAVAALVLGLVSPAHAAAGTGLEGTVTAVGGGGLKAIVYAFDPDTGFEDNAVTAADGSYTLDLPPGTYLVAFESWSDDYEEQYFDHVADFEDATPVTVTDGHRFDADAALIKLAVVSGHVTTNLGDPKYNFVQLLDATTGEEVDEGFVEPSGDYSVSLPAGSYKVAFNRLSGPAMSAAEFWKDHPEASGVGTADTITLAAGAERDGVDATLDLGGSFTGHLVDQHGQPLVCQVQAITTNHSLVTRTTTSAPDGSFDLTGLSTGDYLVRVVSSSGCHNGMQYAAGSGPLVTTVGAAQPVHATLGTATPMATALQYDVGTPFASTVAPTVTGVPVVGQVLRAQPGSWTPTPHSFRYQWFANGSQLNAERHETFTVPAGDVGAAITVRVTARGPGHPNTSATSAPVTVIAPSAPPPPPILNISYPPGLFPRVNERIRTRPGKWSVPGATFRYVFSSGPTVWQDSASPDFTPPEASLGQLLTLTVVASAPGYSDGRVSITSFKPVGSGVWQLVGHHRAQLSGTPRLGSTLTCDPGKLSPTPTKVTFTWTRDGQTIHGAKTATYTLTRADVGHHIRVHVSYQRVHYEHLTQRTNVVGPVHG